MRNLSTNHFTTNIFVKLQNSNKFILLLYIGQKFNDEEDIELVFV